MSTRSQVSLRLSGAATALLALIFCAAQAISQDCGCNAVLIPSISWVKNNSRYQLDTLEIMDKETFSSLSTSADANATFPINGVPIKFNGNWDQFKEDRDHIFTQKGFNSSSQQSLNSLSSAVPEANVKAWQSCKQLCSANTGNSGFRCLFVNEEANDATLIVQTGPSAVVIDNTQIAGGTFGDRSVLSQGTGLGAGTTRSVLVQRSGNTVVNVVMNASGYSCQAQWSQQMISPPPPVPTSWHAHLNSPRQITSSGCVSLALDGGDGTVSTRFFRAPEKGDYLVSVHTEGPYCPECYDVVMQLFASANAPTDQTQPLRHSAITTTNKVANWDDQVTISMQKGDGLWLSACPCGDEHCQGGLNTAVTQATVEIERQ